MDLEFKKGPYVSLAHDGYGYPGDPKSSVREGIRFNKALPRLGTVLAGGVEARGHLFHFFGAGVTIYLLFEVGNTRTLQRFDAQSPRHLPSRNVAELVMFGNPRTPSLTIPTFTHLTHQ